MILVTVGTTPFNFNRLLKAVDELIEKGKVKERVVMQIGHSTYEPRNAEWFRLASYREMEELNRKARVVITHGGAGSILTALKFGKPVIAVPRLKKFNEHTDDHQIDLVKNLSKEGKLIGVFDVKNLYEAIQKAKRVKKIGRRGTLVKEIKKYIEHLQEG